MIQDLYFGKGSKLFAMPFNHHFPTYPGHDRELHSKVPIPMVALIVMAVSEAFFFAV